MSKSLVEILNELDFKYQSTDGQWVIYAANGSNYNETILCAVDSVTGCVTIDRQRPDTDDPQLWINVNHHDSVIETILTHLTR